MSFFKKVFALIVGFSAYPGMGLQPVRKVLAFLLRVSALSAFLMVMGLLPRFLYYSGSAADWLGRNLPAGRIEQGRYATDAQLPVSLNHDLFSIQVVGPSETPVAANVNKDRPAGFIFEPEQVRMVFFTQEPDLEVVERAFPFDLLPDGVVDAAYLRALFRKMIWQSLPIEFLVVWLSAFAFAVGLALFLTGINRVLVRITQRPDLPLIPMFNLCCLAQTPALMLTTSYIIMGMWRWQLQGIYFILYTVYWIGGSVAFRRQVPWIAMGPPPPGARPERAGAADAEDEDDNDGYLDGPDDDEDDRGEEEDPAPRGSARCTPSLH